MDYELMASMMCADYSNLGEEVRMLEDGGIDSFHIDIMDGRYVHNFAMSLNDMCCIRKLANKPLDVHLMVEHPLNTIELFINNLRKGDTI
nr:ribulose phosphate epimerase [Lachnospiraceae bacterium]